ncbi:TPA: hypothetical protein ACHR4D_003052 [Enterobacter kobei]
MKPSYEELEARCAALAAENALLKKSDPAPFSKLMMEALDVYQAGADEVPELAMLSAYKKLREGLKTPATEAILAEVRASGVEMAVDVVKQCYDNICAGGLQENREYEESIVQPHLDGIDDELKEIIAQLRKGVQS